MFTTNLGLDIYRLKAQLQNLENALPATQVEPSAMINIPQPVFYEQMYYDIKRLLEDEAWEERDRLKRKYPFVLGFIKSKDKIVQPNHTEALILMARTYAGELLFKHRPLALTLKETFVMSVYSKSILSIYTPFSSLQDILVLSVLLNFILVILAEYTPQLPETVLLFLLLLCAVVFYPAAYILLRQLSLRNKFIRNKLGKELPEQTMDNLIAQGIKIFFDVFCIILGYKIFAKEETLMYLAKVSFTQASLEAVFNAVVSCCWDANIYNIIQIFSSIICYVCRMGPTLFFSEMFNQILQKQDIGFWAATSLKAWVATPIIFYALNGLVSGFEQFIRYLCFIEGISWSEAFQRSFNNIYRCITCFYNPKISEARPSETTALLEGD